MKTLLLGGNTISLDPSGAAFLVESRTLLVANVNYSPMQSEMFPEHGPIVALEEAVARLVGIYAPLRIIVLNEHGTAEVESFSRFLSQFAAETIFIGNPGLDAFRIGDLSVGVSGNTTAIVGAPLEASEPWAFVQSSTQLQLPRLKTSWNEQVEAEFVPLVRSLA